MSEAMKKVCLDGDLKQVEIQLAAGESVNSVTSGGSTPILLALRNDHISLANWLLAKGADLSKVNNNGWNALHYAAQEGSF
jgi:ankyrin repeat protein